MSEIEVIDIYSEDDDYPEGDGEVEFRGEAQPMPARGPTASDVNATSGQQQGSFIQTTEGDCGEGESASQRRDAGKGPAEHGTAGLSTGPQGLIPAAPTPPARSPSPLITAPALPHFRLLLNESPEPAQPEIFQADAKPLAQPQVPSESPQPERPPSMPNNGRQANYPGQAHLPVGASTADEGRATVPRDEGDANVGSRSSSIPSARQQEQAQRGPVRNGLGSASNLLKRGCPKGGLSALPARKKPRVAPQGGQCAIASLRWSSSKPPTPMSQPEARPEARDHSPLEGRGASPLPLLGDPAGLGHLSVAQKGASLHSLLEDLAEMGSRFSGSNSRIDVLPAAGAGLHGTTPPIAAANPPSPCADERRLHGEGGEGPPSPASAGRNPRAGRDPYEFPCSPGESSPALSVIDAPPCMSAGEDAPILGPVTSSGGRSEAELPVRPGQMNDAETHSGPAIPMEVDMVLAYCSGTAGESLRPLGSTLATEEACVSATPSPAGPVEAGDCQTSPAATPLRRAASSPKHRSGSGRSLRLAAGKGPSLLRAPRTASRLGGERTVGKDSIADATGINALGRSRGRPRKSPLGGVPAPAPAPPAPRREPAATPGVMPRGEQVTLDSAVNRGPPPTSNSMLQERSGAKRKRVEDPAASAEVAPLVASAPPGSPAGSGVFTPGRGHQAPPSTNEGEEVEGKPDTTPLPEPERKACLRNSKNGMKLRWTPEARKLLQEKVPGANPDWECPPKHRDLPVYCEERAPKILAGIKKLMAKSEDQRQSSMRQKVYRYEISDVNHPAKKHGLQIGRGVENGLKANTKIRSKDVVGEYCGVVKTNEEALREVAELADEVAIVHHDKEFEMPACPRDEDDLALDGHGVDLRLLVDGGAKGYGNDLAYINDPKGTSKTANVKAVQAWYNNVPHVFIVAVVDINPGDEILMDYGEGYHRMWAENHARVKAILDLRKQVADGKKQHEDLKEQQKARERVHEEEKAALARERDAALQKCEELEQAAQRRGARESSAPLPCARCELLQVQNEILEAARDHAQEERDHAREERDHALEGFGKLQAKLEKLPGAIARYEHAFGCSGTT